MSRLQQPSNQLGARHRLSPSTYQSKSRYAWGAACRPRELAHKRKRFAYYRRPGSFSGDLSVGNPCMDLGCGWDGYAYTRKSAGGMSGFYICGVTRDNAGAALGICVVQGFRTSDDAYLGETISGPTGEFCFVTQLASPTQHYLVCYQSSTPTTVGASTNTLTAVTTRTY